MMARHNKRLFKLYQTYVKELFFFDSEKAIELDLDDSLSAIEPLKKIFKSYETQVKEVIKRCKDVPSDLFAEAKSIYERFLYWEALYTRLRSGITYDNPKDGKEKPYRSKQEFYRCWSLNINDKINDNEIMKEFKNVDESYILQYMNEEELYKMLPSKLKAQIYHIRTFLEDGVRQLFEKFRYFLHDTFMPTCVKFMWKEDTISCISFQNKSHYFYKSVLLKNKSLTEYFKETPVLITPPPPHKSKTIIVPGLNTVPVPTCTLTENNTPLMITNQLPPLSEFFKQRNIPMDSTAANFYDDNETFDKLTSSQQDTAPQFNLVNYQTPPTTNKRKLDEVTVTVLTQQTEKLELSTQSDTPHKKVRFDNLPENTDQQLELVTCENSESDFDCTPMSLDDGGIVVEIQQAENTTIELLKTRTSFSEDMEKDVVQQTVFSHMLFSTASRIKAAANDTNMWMDYIGYLLKKDGESNVLDVDMDLHRMLDCVFYIYKYSIMKKLVRMLTEKANAKDPKVIKTPTLITFVGTESDLEKLLVVADSCDTTESFYVPLINNGEKRLVDIRLKDVLNNLSRRFMCFSKYFN